MRSEITHYEAWGTHHYEKAVDTMFRLTTPSRSARLVLGLGLVAALVAGQATTASAASSIDYVQAIAALNASDPPPPPPRSKWSPVMTTCPLAVTSAACWWHEILPVAPGKPVH